MTKTVDSIQKQVTDYACDLRYTGLSSEAIHAAKALLIDTLGALIGGFFGESCRIARNLAAQMPDPHGATVIGTRMKTSLDMAALVNGTTSRYAELNDDYHRPGSHHGHASDALTSILGVAEQGQVDGRELITSIVLSYEVFLRFSDVFHNAAFDNTNFACLSTAVAAGQLMGLSPAELAHCISMAVVPNNILTQVRLSHLSMFKAVAAGHAGRAGVFAAMLARAGMEGPHLPFEGKAGWCDHVARGRFLLGAMGGNGTPFKILETRIKNRPSNAVTLAPILAAEKLAPMKNLNEVKQITVEVNKRAKEFVGTGERAWNPDSRETADHSAPYVVAATLIDGTITLRSFNDVHLWNPELRALMQKVEVIENEEFTKAHQRLPQQHRARVTVLSRDGERLVGEAGGDQDDLAAPKSDAQIVEKFRGLTEDFLGTKRVDAILDRLWNLESLQNAAAIPPDFVLG